MKVIKTFYNSKEKKTYKVGDDYDGIKFNNIELYVEIPKPKKKAIKKTK